MKEELISYMNLHKGTFQKIFISFVIFIIFLVIATYYKNILQSNSGNSKKKDVIYKELSHIAYYIILWVGIVIAICNLGINVASILTILATLGFAIGLAIQGILTGISASIYLGIINLYEINDIIEVDGHLGYVKDFDLFNTYLLEANTLVTIIIPNTNIQKSIVINHTKNKEKISLIKFTVSSNNNNHSIKEIINNMHDALSTCPFITNKNNININVCNSSSYGTTIGVKAPIISAGMIAAELSMNTLIRDALYKQNVLLLDNSYLSSYYSHS